MSGDWDALKAKADPVELMKLIHDTHYLDATAVASKQKSKVRNDFYGKFRMKQCQNVSAYRQEFEWHLAMLDKLGMSIGTDEDVAGIFLDKLNDGYDGLRDEQERNEKNGLALPPKSLPEAYQLALKWTPAQRPQSSSATVFTTEVRRSSNYSNTNSNKSLLISNKEDIK